MKNLKFPLAFILSCLMAFSANAQGLNWLTAGNTATGVEKLGTLNGFPVRFFTNNVERMRLNDGAATKPSVLMIGMTTGTYDANPNATSIKLNLDILNPVATTYGANMGTRAQTSANGSNVTGNADAHLATSSSWGAGGSITGVTGVANASKINAPTGNSGAFGGSFNANMKAATLSSTGANSTIVTGVRGSLTGTITTYPTKGYVAAVAGDDGINAANTYAGYFLGKVYCSSSLFVASDRRFKSNIQTINGSLDLIGKMRGVSYEYDQAKFADRSFAAGKTDGFIAQELREIMPELVHEGSDGYLAVNYIGVIPVLTEAVKELKAQKDAEIGRLEEQIEEKDRQINALAARMAKLEALVIDSRSGSISTTPEAIAITTRPNPFTDATTVAFNLSENVQHAALIVTDLQGKVVLEQALEARGQGNATLSFNGLASGTYVCTLLADGQPVATTKMAFQSR